MPQRPPAALTSFLLVDHAVQPETLRRYRKSYDEFSRWLHNQVHAGRLRPPFSVDDVDTALARWFQDAYAQNKARGQRAKCERARLCIKHYCPDWSLKYSARALTAWAKLVPAHATTPVPRSLMLLMTEYLLATGDLQAAVAISMSFDCYLRSASELLPVQLEDIMLPQLAQATLGAAHGVLHLRHTKTGPHKSVLLRPNDISTHLLEHLVHHRRQRGQAKLVLLSATAYRKIFYQTLSALGLPEDHPYRPYALRHGGATDAFLCGDSIDQIAARGRWARRANCEKYVQLGRAMLAGLALPTQLLQRADYLLQHPFAVLHHLPRV